MTNPPRWPLPDIPQHYVANIDLPREVGRLFDLSYNFWWSWSGDARSLFSRVDRRAWALYRNPVQLLINVERAHWSELLEDEFFMDSYSSVVRAFEGYMEGWQDSWLVRRYPERSAGVIAYLSMEFGIDQSLAIYSGGLGILSGDHLKSASDLGLPMIGVGLLYRRGYFRQTLDADGLQQQFFPEYDFTRLPLRAVANHTRRDLIVTVPLAGREVSARVWLAQVGRVPLLLLDTDIPQNDPADRPITSILYTQGRQMRLEQELVLGVGGARALEALGIEPSVWHLNEGHCALAQLERLSHLVSRHSKSPDEAMETIRASSVFTTHTPVPAGNERFDASLAALYLAPFTEGSGRSQEELEQLGRGSEEDLNLTALALRTSSYANGVSQLHAEVSRSMWQSLFERESADDVPIDAITNGVHLPTWMGKEIHGLLGRHLGLEWQEWHLMTDLEERIAAVPDAELWSAHMAQKERLARFLRSRLMEQRARHGHSPAELRRVDSYFQAEALTIGFARRFATYKRADLIFSDPHALRRLLSDSDRPVQLLFAGKAHPADRPGQELIKHIFQLSQSEDLRGRVFFLEGYDMRMARMLVQGCSVWLNTPRRPQEACGTSGQKAAMNGLLNVSVLDGWWPECWSGDNGWAIGDQHSNGDAHQQDREDVQSLYRVLEDEVIPTYFDRQGELPSARWIAHMKRSIASVVGAFSSHRMVIDYAERAYLPRIRQPQGVS